MRTGSLPLSALWSLPAGAIEPNHAPDGLDEAAIDALIEEAWADVPDAPTRPAWLSTDPVERRRVRRRVRRAVRLLAVPNVPAGPTDGRAA
jgi:8-oxo-dGTP pyrophosphatase MutT (NUDIX family)